MKIAMREAVKGVFSIEEYLAYEQEVGTKCEFHNGEVFAMAGGTRNHTILCTQIYDVVRDSLRKSDIPCRPYTSEMRIALDHLNSFVSPDLSVFCGPIEWSKKEPNSAINPIAVVEVLSESSESYDRGEKFYKYRQLDSLKDYLLIDQDKAVVEVFSRESTNGLWKITRASELSESIELPSMGIEISLKELYEGVEVSI